MFKDKEAIENFKKIDSEILKLKASIRLNEQWIEREEQALGKVEERLIYKYALVQKGAHLKNRQGEVWKVNRVFVDWRYDAFDFKYDLKLVCSDAIYKQIYHNDLKKEIDSGEWNTATDKDKSLAKHTVLQQIVKHESNETHTFQYIATTIKGKCIVFQSWDDELHKICKHPIKLVRNSKGTYELKHKRDYLGTVTIVAVYENYRELATDFLV